MVGGTRFISNYWDSQSFVLKFSTATLMEEGGSITRAAQRLGIPHQNLGFMLKTRHKNLQSKRKPEIKRSIIRKGK